jgi:diguanylate cyclase (GGDEF)-like protein/PAS domain S-box-containing protein
VSLMSKFAALEGLFVQVFENADGLICLTNTEGQFEYANPSFCKALGFSGIEEIKEQTIVSLYAEKCLDETSLKMQEALEDSQKWHGEVSLNKGEVEEVWYKCIASPVLNDQGCVTHFMWTQFDITEQKNLERKQWASEQRLRSLLDNVPAYVFSKDREGKYTYANKMLSMLHALHVDDIIGKTDFDLFPRDAALTFEKNDINVFEKNKTMRAIEYAGVDEYGIERCYLSVKCPLENEEGQVEELLGMSVDISEQHRLERALRESEKRLNDILDNMKARVYIKDRNLKYTYANEELCRIANTDRINLIGKDDYELFETETAVVFRTTDLEVFESEKRIERMEVSVEPGRSRKQYFWSVKMPLKDEYGNVHSLLGISTDLTEEKNLQEALRKSENQLSTILDNIKAHVYIKDVNFVYTYVNADMCEYLGKNKEDVVGKSDVEVFGYEASKGFHGIDQQVFDYVETCSCVETSKPSPDAEDNYFWSVKVPLINDLGNPYALLGISTNITEQKRLENELREMAATDVLTGVHNRRRFLELCEIEIQRAKRYNNALSMVMLDVDWFKTINDTYGHAVGDEAIKSMTRLCQKMLRTTDVLGRIGGEEFAILLTETQLDGAQVIAERIRKSAEEYTFDTGTGVEGRFTASFGLTSLVATDQNPDDLLKRADIALYQAKAGGRNRVCVG